MDMNIGQLIQTLNLSQLVQTFFGTIFGGFIVIFTNWWTERGERRKTTQERNEQTYIIEGIDPLAEYYQRLSLSLFNKSNKNIISIVEKDVPVEAINKVRILLNNVVPLNIIFRAHGHLTYTQDQQMLGAAGNIMQEAVNALLNYRERLTTEIFKSANTLHQEKETARLISTLENTSNQLELLEKQRLEKERELNLLLIKSLSQKVLQRKVPLSIPNSIEELRSLRKQERKNLFHHVQ